MVDVITVLLLSILAGLLGSLVGLGGSLITTPALVALGVPVKYAIAAGMVTIIATSSGSASSYVREKIVNVKAAMFLERFTVVGAIVGASVTSIVPAKLLYFFFAAFLLTSFVGIGRRGREEVPQAVNQDGLARWLQLEGSYHDKSLGKDVNYKLTRPALGGAGMFVAGIAAGMLGGNSVRVRGRDLETIISYILTIGVLVSLAVEAVGLGYYYATTESLQVDFTSRWQTSGNDFFAYAWGTLLSLGEGATPLSLIALGIVLLMVTPYLRVLASVLYFTVGRNPKYAVISLFVLAVLTVSLK